MSSLDDPFDRNRAGRRSGWPMSHTVLAISVVGGMLLAASARAESPLNTYYGPGLPLDSYFPQGVPGDVDEPGVTVRSRLRSDYDAPGIQAGPFIIRPMLDETLGYDDNIVGGENGQGSTLIESNASASANTNFSRDNLGVTANVDDFRYPDRPRQSHTDYSGSVGGEVDIGRDALDLSASHLSGNQEPYDLGATGAFNVQLAKPLSFTDDDIRISYTTTAGRFTFVPNVDYQLLRLAHGDFSGVASDLESFYDQSLRDRNVLQGGVVARYELQPQRQVVVVLNGSDNHYIRTGGQDSRNFTVLAGLDYLLSGSLTARALIGFQERSYSSAQYSSQGEPIAEADLIWTPTGLTTVTARYSRTMEDATADTFTGYVYDRVSLVVDHEYLRNVLLQASVRYEHADYLDSEQTQAIYTGGVGVTWLLNRHLQLALSEEFSDHENSGMGQSFTRNVVLLHARVGF